MSRTRAVEEDVLLQNDGGLAPEPGGIGKGKIDAIDQHAAAFGDVKPLDQLGERAFSRARRPDNADDLACRDREGDIGKTSEPSMR